MDYMKTIISSTGYKTELLAWQINSIVWFGFFIR